MKIDDLQKGVDQLKRNDEKYNTKSTRKAILVSLGVVVAVALALYFIF